MIFLAQKLLKVSYSLNSTKGALREILEVKTMAILTRCYGFLR